MFYLLDYISLRGISRKCGDQEKNKSKIEVSPNIIFSIFQNQNAAGNVIQHYKKEEKPYIVENTVYKWCDCLIV